jgi:hypothetical protein
LSNDLKCITKFDDQPVIIRKHSLDLGQVLAIGVCEGGRYKLLIDPMKNGALLHSNDNLFEHRYKCLIHLQYGALPLLTKWWWDCLISRWRTRVCKGCALNKHVMTLFSSNEHKTGGILNPIHLDVCEPMSLASLTSNIYYIFSMMTLLGKPTFIL